MLRKNNYYQYSILNSEGNNKFTSDILGKIKEILKPEFDIDLSDNY